MKRQRFLGLAVAALGIFACTGHSLFAAPVDDLVAAAKKEGTLELYAPSTLTPEGAQALAQAFNKKYNLSVAVQYSPSGNMTRDIGRIVGNAATGVAPEWDIMIVTDAHHGTLWLRKLHKALDYRQLGVDAKSIQYDGGVVSLANQFVLPAYNKDILPASDVPKKWEDLLNPKFKGKMGVSTATHHLARLAFGPWGEKKTTEFVRAVAKQEPSLGNMATLANRLLLGEILIMATVSDSEVTRAKKTGAPIVFAEGIEPVVSPAYHVGVLKGAQHPNAGHLFSAFMVTHEAQNIWEKYGGQTSAFVSGTSAYKYVQGKQVIYMTQDQAKEMDRLARDYGRILGYK